METQNFELINYVDEKTLWEHFLNVLKFIAYEEYLVSFGRAKFVFFDFQFIVNCLKEDKNFNFLQTDLYKIFQQLVDLGLAYRNVEKDESGCTEVIYSLSVDFAVDIH